MSGGITAAIDRGMGVCIARNPVTLRNLNGSTLAKGGIYTLDFLHGNTGVNVHTTGGYGNRDHPWSNSDIIAASATRTTWPCLIPDDNVLDGKSGKFWISHPEIMAVIDTTDATTMTPAAPGNGATFSGAPFVADSATGTNGVRYLNAAGDILSSGYARFIGWSLEPAEATLAGFVTMAFDGLHLGLVGAPGA